MAAQSWPSSLPVNPIADAYDEVQLSPVTRTKTEVGPGKQRRRFTATFKRFSVAFLLDRDQVDTFETFWADTLSHGALRFDLRHPRLDKTIEFRFPKGLGEDAFRIAPTSSEEDDDLFEVSFTLESLP